MNKITMKTNMATKLMHLLKKTQMSTKIMMRRKTNMAKKSKLTVPVVKDYLA